MGRESSSAGSEAVTWIILALYISELVLRMFALHPYLFFTKIWNWFDFLVSSIRERGGGRRCVVVVPPPPPFLFFFWVPHNTLLTMDCK
jgi:hypothetical protein